MSLEERCKSPSRNRIWCILTLKWHLVATILMIFLRINWPSFNLEARTYDHAYVCCTISIQFVHGRKTGHLASREGLGRVAGQWGLDTGRPGKYGTVGNPIREWSPEKTVLSRPRRRCEQAIRHQPDWLGRIVDRIAWIHCDKTI